MPGSRSIVATDNASRYLQQLCKHFAHKVGVEYDAHRASIDFPFGACRMEAEGAELRIECRAADPEALKRAEQVVGGHLVRFAFRETLEIRWEPAEGEAA